MSSSYVMQTVTDPTNFHAALDSAFDSNARNGEVVLEYETVVVAWQ